MTEVTMYTTSWCPFCRRAKSLLVSKAARLHEIDVDRVAGGRQEVMERSGRRTVPQIWIGPHHVGGCDELFALERAGKLDALLAG